jgi:5'-3' exonuclease
MIIVDLNQVMISNFMSQIGNHTDTKIDEGLFRHMVLNSIRSFKTKFSEYGQLIIACDDKKTWRRDFFPHYKANRKKTRDNSELDWSSIFNILNKIKLELKEFFPYPVVQVENAEADDVIASIVDYFNNIEDKILILSGDKDFRQLQKYSNVEQFDPVNKKFIKDSNPDLYLKELIIKGDRGDGVPNVLSPDDTFINNVRQKAISSKKLKQWLDTEVEELLVVEHELKINWERNQKLIDLTFIPDDLREKVILEYTSQLSKGRDKIFSYMINNKCKYLLEHINEF